MHHTIAWTAVLSITLATLARAQEVPATAVTVEPSTGSPGRRPLVSFQAPSTLDQIDTDQASAKIGHGYDPITNHVLPMTCVVAKDPDFDLGDGTISVKKKSLVSSEKSYSKSSGSAVSASALIKAIQIGVGTSQSHSTAFNSVDSYGRLFNRIATKGAERTTVRWSDEALPLIQKADMTDFLSQCGTRFVRGVYSGQQLDTIVSFVLRQDQNSASSATSVSVSVAKIFGASASFSQAAADANQYSDSYIENNGKGSLGVSITAASGVGGGAGSQPSSPPGPSTPSSPPPAGGTSSSSGASTILQTDASSLKSTLDYYENGFAKAVKDAGPQVAKDTAVPLYIITDHYQGNLLPMASKVPVWADGIYTAVAAKADTYNDLITVINDLTSALAPGTNIRLGIFYKDDPAYPATQKLKDAKSKLAGFQKAVSDCQTSILSGKEFTSGQSVVDKCSADLDAKLVDDDITKLALARVYSKPAP